METVKGTAISDGIVIGTVQWISDVSATADDSTRILFAEELFPNQVLKLFKQNICSFVLERCSDTSHAAILARGADMPSLFGVAVKESWHDKIAIVDGYEGVLIIDPDRDTLAAYEQKRKEKERKIALLNAYKGKRSRTLQGKEVKIYANINKPSDLLSAIKHDAEGVFFKTEFLYIDVEDYPTEEAQLEVYKDIILGMQGKPVVIRTADIGADKTADYFHLDHEDNPALGFRGIRLSLARYDIFKIQLRAILRASAFGSVAIMFPMIVSVNEVIAAKNALEDAMQSLEKEGVCFDRNIRIGIMIETPAAAILSGELAELVDFFSIGTNDLIQYTLAADRQNPKLKDVYDPYHPAVLSLVRYVIENGVKAGIEVGISGELGGDLTLTERLVLDGMKVFAVAPARILQLRKRICEME